MVTRLRSVSSRICCGHYLNTVNRIPAEENTFYFPKPIRCVTLAGENAAFTPIPGRNITVPSKMYNPENMLQPLNNVCAYSNAASRDSLTLFNGNDSVNLSSIFESDFHKDLISLSGANRDKADSDSSLQGRPSTEQLEVVFQYLSEALPRLFQRPLKADMFHQNVVLENNIRKTRHVGIGKYIYQLALFKVLAHFKFAYVRFHVLKLTKHPETGTIKCRWRISGISGTAVIFQFWKFPVTKLRNKVEEAPTWYDGFSTYFVGSDGLIHKHIIDKMMPDDDHVPIDKTITPKVALFLGLLPKPEQDAFINFIRNTENRTSMLPTTMLPNPSTCEA